MQQAITNVAKDKYKGIEVNSVMISGRKYYFYSDLEKHFGSSFTAYLKTPVIQRSVTHNGNGQARRRLVSVSDFKSAASKMPEVLKKKTVRTTKNCCSQNSYVTALTLPPKRELVQQEFVYHTPTIETSKLRAEIVDAINDLAARYTEKQKGDSFFEADVRLNLYKTIYSRFDKIMSDELAKTNRTLASVGITKGKNYLDKIQRAGFIPAMHKYVKEAISSTVI